MRTSCSRWSTTSRPRRSKNWSTVLQSSSPRRPTRRGTRGRRALVPDGDGLLPRRGRRGLGTAVSAEPDADYRRPHHRQPAVVRGERIAGLHWPTGGWGRPRPASAPINDHRHAVDGLRHWAPCHHAPLPRGPSGAGCDRQARAGRRHRIGSAGDRRRPAGCARMCSVLTSIRTRSPRRARIWSRTRGPRRPPRGRDVRDTALPAGRHRGRQSDRRGPVLNAARLSSMVARGGTLIVSGVQTHERGEVVAAFSGADLVWSEEEAGWVSLAIQLSGVGNSPKAIGGKVS